MKMFGSHDVMRVNVMMSVYVTMSVLPLVRGKNINAETM